MENHLCDYGCGQEAKFQIKYGGWCCEENHQRCLAIKKKRKEKPNKWSLYFPYNGENICDYGCKRKAKHQLEDGSFCCVKISGKCPNKSIKPKPELCEYGCGLEAKFYLPTPRKWCCSESFNNCRVSRTKRSFTMRNGKFENINHELCDYGCGQEAKFKSNKGKLRCGKSHFSCPEIIKNKPITWNKKILNEPYKEIIDKPKKIVHSNIAEVFEGICDYGCEKPAKFKSLSGKLCCEKTHLQCENFRKKGSERMKINNPMKNPETVQKNFRNHGRQKTGPEKYLENLFRGLNLEILYIGDGRKYINGRSPDFIIPNTKKLIEVYDSSFNYCGEIRGDEWVEKRRNQLHGYNVLFIDFYKLGGIRNYEKLVKIIIEFYGF